MKDKLMIIGASGHGKVVADIALNMNKWNEIVFLDDNENIKSSMGIEVIGKSKDYRRYINKYNLFVAIGNNLIRKKILEKLQTENADIPILIHPNAIIGEKVQLGIGTVVMSGVVINCSTAIGKGVIINTGSTIDHDNFIDDYVHISPGVHLAGNVNIGKESWIGIGSIVSNNLNITDSCVIGAGTVVVDNITETGTYIGVPARKIQ